MCLSKSLGAVLEYYFQHFQVGRVDWQYADVAQLDFVSFDNVQAVQ